jgi:hypothetical protein
MPLTYAGVDLILPEHYPGYNDTVGMFLDRKGYFRANDLRAADFLPWKGLDGEPWHGIVGSRPGTLVWPTGASRWSEGWFYAGKAEKDAILAVTSGVTSANLVLDDGTGGSVTASMYMLPPRPISQIQGAGFTDYREPLYLCQFVDDRFFWQGRKYEGFLSPNTQVSAAALLAAIQVSLGQTFTIEAYSSTQLCIPGLVDGRFRSIPLLLDAVCQSLGLRLVANLNGSYSLIQASTGQTRQTSNVALGTPFTGGQLGWGPTNVDPNTDTENYLPSFIAVHFPQVLNGQVTGDPNYVNTQANPVTTGNGATWDLHTLEAAQVPTQGALPSNKVTLDTYAPLYATAWAKWQTGYNELHNSGITPWVPDGLHRFEWNYTDRDYCTSRSIRETYEVDFVWACCMAPVPPNFSGLSGFSGVTYVSGSGCCGCFPMVSGLSSGSYKNLPSGVLPTGCGVFDIQNGNLIVGGGPGGTVTIIPGIPNTDTGGLSIAQNLVTGVTCSGGTLSVTTNLFTWVNGILVSIQ